MQYLASSDDSFVDLARHGFHVLGYPRFRQGVLVYLSPSLNVKPLMNFCICIEDLCVVSLLLNDLVIVFAYCHDGNRVRGHTQLWDLVDQIKVSYSRVIVMGDLNARFDDAGSNAAGIYTFNRLSCTNFFSWCHHIPTRENFHLDYCLDDSQGAILDCTVLDDLSSDHKPVVAQIHLEQNSQDSTTFVSWSRFKKKLHLSPSWNWDLSVDENVSRMHYFVDSLHSDCTIRVTTKKRSNCAELSKKRYITFDKELSTLKSRRNKCRRNSPEWKMHNSVFRKALRQASKKNWQETQEDFIRDRNGIGIWSLLRRVRLANRPSERIYHPSEVADHFKEFHKVEPELEAAALSVDRNAIEDYMELNSVVDGVTALEISGIIKQLPKSNGVGEDKVPYKIFRDAPERTIQWLVDCCNSILQSGDWPSVWKLALIRPLPKASGGYRPISLLCCVSKILERVVYRRLKQFGFDNNIFLGQFAASGGCEKAMDSLLQYVESQLPNHVYVVYFDVKKAFDRVVRLRLLSQLVHHGFPSYLVRVVSSFLLNRRYRITGSSSSYEPDHGVPQGSVLGPILFQLLIADLLKNLPVDHAAAYADDMCIASTAADGDLLQESLDEIGYRARFLGIDFDARKTKIMEIIPKQCRKFNHDAFTFKNQELEYTNSYKYLGITIDSRLTFGDCIKQKKQVARQRIAVINRLSLVSSSWRRSMYLGYVQSYLYYCLRPIWRFLADNWRNQMSAVVEYGGRMICGLTMTSFGGSTLAAVRSPESFCSPVPVNHRLLRLRTPAYLLRQRPIEVPLLRCLNGTAWCNHLKFRRKLIPSPMCRFCFTNVETSDHLLFDCPRLSCPERIVIMNSVGSCRTLQSLPRNHKRHKYYQIAEAISNFLLRWDLHF